MKKSILLASAFAAIIFYSCTEKEAFNTASNGTIVSDTTYITSSPVTANPRKVLVEEATGVLCTNCPAGAELLKKAEETNDGKLIIIGLHGGNLSSPIRNESKDTLRSAVADDLYSQYFSEDPNKPAAAIDRMKQNGSYFYARTQWLSVISERLTISSPLNLSITSEFDASTEEFTIAVTGVYTAEVTNKQDLTVELTEDNIHDAQEGDGGVLIEDYIHNHVLRDKVTSSTYGDPLLDDLTAIEKGRVFVKVFKYKIPDAKKAKWNVANMNIVAFVHNHDNKEVQQVEEIKLKPED